MMHFLFPTTVYTDVNTDLLGVANEMYRQSEHMNNPKIRADFRSTLKAFAPGNAVVYEKVLEWEVTQKLVQFIERSAAEWVKGNMYDLNKYKIRVVNMWLNEMEPGSEHRRHSHYGYSLSGTYYVACPSGAEGITIHSPADPGTYHELRHVKETNLLNTLNVTIPVEPGMIVLFSSNINHSVSSGSFQGVRRSIAFDIILEPLEAMSY
jgi:uncharacterized protein (TIGR02466 family)